MSSWVTVSWVGHMFVVSHPYPDLKEVTHVEASYGLSAVSGIVAVEGAVGMNMF